MIELWLISFDEGHEACFIFSLSPWSISTIETSTVRPTDRRLPRRSISPSKPVMSTIQATAWPCSLSRSPKAFSPIAGLPCCAADVQDRHKTPRKLWTRHTCPCGRWLHGMEGSCSIRKEDTSCAISKLATPVGKGISPPIWEQWRKYWL